MSDEDREWKRRIARLTRRSLFTGAAASLAGFGAWEWIRTRREEGGTPWPLRAGLMADEELSRDYFREARLAPTYPASAVENDRPNGDIGLENDPDPDWKLHFEDASLTLADVHSLPRISMVTELKCIEGWSRVQQFTGARFSDLVARYYQDELSPDTYVGLETPGGEYYVGLDLAAAMHPQTLLVYEMNGAPLSKVHGAPLRLFTPLKYGIKSLKRVGKIEFSDSRPKDYWAEQGYDWYAGF